MSKNEDKNRGLWESGVLDTRRLFLLDASNAVLNVLAIYLCGKSMYFLCKPPLRWLAYPPFQANSPHFSQLFSHIMLCFYTNISAVLLRFVLFLPILGVAGCCMLHD